MVAVDEPYGSQASVEALDDARIHGQSYDSVVAKLEKLARTKPGDGASTAQTRSPTPTSTAQKDSLQESSSLFAALTALLRRQPETVPRTLDKIRKNSPARDVLVDALGSSGSPVALAGLLDLANAKAVDAKLKARALTALARTSKPSAQAIAALEAMVREDPANMGALYGLGTYSHRLRDSGDQAGAGAIGVFLVDRLQFAKDIIPRVMSALTALGNSGYDPAIDRISPYLEAANDTVRAAAVGALRSMRDTRADQLIAMRMQIDPSTEVRISALDAARAREPGDVLTRALSDAAITASDARVRYRAVDLMIQWLRVRPALREALVQVAAKDSEPQVRDRAQAAL